MSGEAAGFPELSGQRYAFQLFHGYHIMGAPAGQTVEPSPCSVLASALCVPGLWVVKVNKRREPSYEGIGRVCCVERGSSM